MNDAGTWLVCEDGTVVHLEGYYALWLVQRAGALGGPSGEWAVVILGSMSAPPGTMWEVAKGDPALLEGLRDWITGQLVDGDRYIDAREFPAIREARQAGELALANASNAEAASIARAGELLGPDGEG